MTVGREWFNGEGWLAESYPDSSWSFAGWLWKCP